jgi:hypothetical protein
LPGRFTLTGALVKGLARTAWRCGAVLRGLRVEGGQAVAAPQVGAGMAAMVSKMVLICAPRVRWPVAAAVVVGPLG